VRFVFVPGFTQRAGTWDAVRAVLPPDIESVALDLPSGLDFPATAAALRAAGGPGVYVGYSLGGRLCLQLGLDDPDAVEALVLVSATPGIADAAERAARRESDDARAREVERDGANAFVARWLTQPLFAGLPPAAAGPRLGAGDEAALVHQLRVLGQGVQEPLWDRLEELDVPVLLVTGADDAKYSALADAMFERIDDCMHVRLEGGHALPLEQPEALAGALVTFAHDITE
jgi:2-succinyl-6-hydroxy-2,4-cyclohexadiene-1-carboxylate synthase